MLRQWSRVVILMSCAAALAGCLVAGSTASASDDRTPLAVKFVQSVADNKFAEATEQFDATMAQAMSADQLKQTWGGVISQHGAFKKTGETRTDQVAGFDVVFVECQLEKGTFDIKLVFDKDGKISGLWLVPHVSAAAAHYTIPDYVHADRFDERQVTVVSGEHKLPGTLSIPKGKGPFPGVVLVHGSGPNDRDETIGPNKPFRDIAGGLASMGIAVLRYDKRTQVYPVTPQTAEKITAKDEVTDDALAAVKLLRNSEKIDSKRVFVLGHSLGGMLAPRIGKSDPKIAGLIIMAGPIRPLEDLILDQLTYMASLNGPMSENAKKQIEKMKQKVALVKSSKLSLSDSASDLPLGVPASYWLDLRGYHPAEVAKSLTKPILIVQGGRDYQVEKKEYDGWAKALSGRTNVSFKLYPDLNHLFMPGTGKSTPSEYEKRSPIPQNVVEHLAAWIKSH